QARVAGAVRRLPGRPGGRGQTQRRVAVPLPRPGARPDRRRGRRGYGGCHPGCQRRGLRCSRVNALTWLDALLVLIVAVFIAVGAEKKLIGFFVGVGGVVALRALQGMWQSNPALAIAVGVALGVALGLLGRRLVPPGRGPVLAFKIMGGFGGLVMGLALMAALMTSLPFKRFTTNPSAIDYPTDAVPVALQSAFKRSPLIRAGKAILLY